MKHPYETEVRSLLRRLNGHGLSPHSVFDTEDTIVTKTQENAVQAILAVDVSKLYVQDSKGEQTWIWIVLGNGPGEAPSDYSAADTAICKTLDTVITEHYDYWDSK